MEKIYLDAQLRGRTGKEDAKKVRAKGLVPAALYKKSKETFHLLVNDRDLGKVLHTKAGENVILTLRVQEKEGKPKEKTVIIKEIQTHPIKDNIMHVDFGEISLTETIKVKVPLETKGEAVGAKADGGVLERILWELEVECLPTNIPSA